MLTNDYRELKELENNVFLFNIQELLKIIADQQQQIINLLAKEKDSKVATPAIKKKSVTKKKL